MSLPRLALTPGEPAGIGPDLVVQLVQEPFPAELVVVSDPALLEARARQLGLPLAVRRFDADAPPTPQAVGWVTVDAVPLSAPVRCGQGDPAQAHHVLATLERATDGALAGRFQALVTGPVHKGLINEAGIAFSGHTEWLSERTGGALPVMMLVAPGLRVALATTHLPLRAVPDALNAERLRRVMTVLDRDLRRRYGLSTPRILVCGLNPHAGEGGHLGDEEQRIIEPVVASLHAEGLCLIGPLPADTAFTPERLAQADVVLAMYHDQGLPVLKAQGFGQAVNVTLGLPIVRTSVDHGTAFDLAGRGGADVGSFRAAVHEALRLVAAS
ncbi:MAG: 4-hydroxythreonine-4-phosphate dehydrogenase PdxA [Pseudomonadota bacterium]|nr:4-hydroxythreonine-4-phosphate dehydrogenase PdxA [Pseudomonadota bacterium]